MKKNTKKICVVLLLAIVAIASYFVSGTYAKYTRAVSGSDTATVAKFSVDASGLNKEQNATIDLFKAVITLKETSNTSNIPVEYSLDKTNWKKASELTKEVNLDYVGKTSATTTEDVTIYWRWAFEGTDTADTALGEATTAPTVTTQVTATFTQVD